MMFRETDDRGREETGERERERGTVSTYGSLVTEAN